MTLVAVHHVPDMKIHIAKHMLILARVCLAFAASVGLASSSTYKVLYSFTRMQDGGIPGATVTADANGNLFGTTAQGGDSGEGVVYELSQDNNGQWTETVVHSFVHQEGDNPDAAMVFDNQGDLYGTTADGGPTNQGIIFELTPEGNDWTLNMIYDYGLRAGVLLDNGGNVYAPVGPGNFGLGAIAELSPGPSGWTYTSLYSFCAQPKCSDGSNPTAPPVWGVGGSLYGTTLWGGNQKNCSQGSYGCGVVFRLSRNGDNSWTYVVLHSFAAFLTDGQTPTGSLLVDDGGTIYGATRYGGGSSAGTIFKLTPSTIGGNWIESIVYSFPDCSHGCQPHNGLVRDASGNLYGVSGGGNMTCSGFACGVVYRLSPQRNGSWKYSVVHKFNGSDGNGPNGVTVGADGNLYGTTISGGQYNFGAVFEITP